MKMRRDYEERIQILERGYTCLQDQIVKMQAEQIEYRYSE